MRVGVALLLPGPLDSEVDGLRRATGDGALGRIPAHLTLVPPVNVAAERVGQALAVLRGAASRTEPFRLRFGPPATFLPDTPVLYLPVVDGVEEVTALRDRVFVEPLARPLTWPFVPHVTLADEASPERIEAAMSALADYSAEAGFDRVHLLQQHESRMWAPLAEARFGPPAVLGRGGLPIELATTTAADPEAGALLCDGSRQRLVVTARRDGVVAGVAALALAPGEAAMGTGEHLQAALRAAPLDVTSL